MARGITVKHIFRTTVVILFTAALLLPEYSTATEAPPWPIFRGNPALTGVTPGTLNLPLSLVWEFQAQDEIRSSPVIGHNRVFIGDIAGTVYALDRKTGKPVWTFATGAAIEAPPLLVQDRIVIGAMNGTLYALNVANGEALWQYRTGDRIMGSANHIPAFQNVPPQLCFGSYDATLHAIDLNGQARWTYTTEGFINGTPAIASNRVIVGGCDAALHVVSARDGAALTQTAIGSYIAASPAIRKNRAFVGHYGGQIHCIDLASSKIRWSYGDPDQGDAFFSSPAVTDESIVIGCRDKKLHCVNANTGRAKWTFTTGGDIDSSPVICGDHVITASRDGRIYILNLNTGRECWRYDTGSPIVASPAVADGMLTIATEAGHMLTFRGATR